MTNAKNGLSEKYNSLKAHLDERSLRLCAAADARSIGRGGVSSVARATRMSRTTIHAGLKELDNEMTVKKIRRAGAGRKPLAVTDPGILTDFTFSKNE